MQYKYNKYYSHGAPKIVRDFTTHSYTPLTHTTSFHISIQYNHNITAQTTNNTHKAVNQATKPMGSRPVTYRAVDIVMWYFPLQKSKVHFLLHTFPHVALLSPFTALSFFSFFILTLLLSFILDQFSFLAKYSRSVLFHIPLQLREKQKTKNVKNLSNFFFGA